MKCIRHFRHCAPGSPRALVAQQVCRLVTGGQSPLAAAGTGVDRFQFPTAPPPTVMVACSETVCDSLRLLRAGVWVGIYLKEKHFIRRFENYQMPLNEHFRAVEC